MLLIRDQINPPLPHNTVLAVDSKDLPVFSGFINYFLLGQ